MENIKVYVVMWKDRIHKTCSSLSDARSSVTHDAKRWVLQDKESKIGRWVIDKSDYKIIMCVGQKEIDLENN